MKLIFTVFLSIFLLVGSKSYAKDYICEKSKYPDGSTGDVTYLSIHGNQVTTKNEYVEINWTEIPLGYDYKLYKMTNNTSRFLLVIAIQKDDKRTLNITSVKGERYNIRNQVSWGNCSQVGN